MGLPVTSAHSLCTSVSMVFAACLFTSDSPTWSHWRLVVLLKHLRQVLIMNARSSSCLVRVFIFQGTRRLFSYLFLTAHDTFFVDIHKKPGRQWLGVPVVKNTSSRKWRQHWVLARQNRVSMYACDVDVSSRLIKKLPLVRQSGMNVVIIARGRGGWWLMRLGTGTMTKRICDASFDGYKEASVRRPSEDSRKISADNDKSSHTDLTDYEYEGVTREGWSVKESCPLSI